jgi:hypothetical protein
MSVHRSYWKPFQNLGRRGSPPSQMLARQAQEDLRSPKYGFETDSNITASEGESYGPNTESIELARVEVRPWLASLLGNCHGQVDMRLTAQVSRRSLPKPDPANVIRNDKLSLSSTDVQSFDRTLASLVEAKLSDRLPAITVFSLSELRIGIIAIDCALRAFQLSDSAFLNPPHHLLR